ncbi:S10 family peptidase [Novosphingobium terrae]|uniref:S10 family peptidase n=1 Tax=Novosphingobium terrae TaxID=2726189 RepID=UPI00197E401E|nr:peptidase S10 [Novosphingobium terrae]
MNRFRPGPLLLTALAALGAALGLGAAPQVRAQASHDPNAADLPIASSPATATRPADPAALPAPRRFVSHHSIRVGGKPLAYTAIAGETYLHNDAGEATGSIFSFSYIKDGPLQTRRPVMFVFNGGPGSSSIWLHMGIVGPRRVVLDRDVNPSNVPPFGLADNPDTLLDVADLVFIDPVGTGWSRAIGVGHAADFWGVNEDADAVSQFIEQWLSDHNRWNSPKYVMGESYGSTRAALLPRALMGGPTYVGVMRGITLNGVILLGTTLEAREASGAPHLEMKDALELPAIADTAWYYRKVDRKGLDLEAFHAAAYDFALGDYARALAQEKAGTLPPQQRQAIIARLTAWTGLPASSFEKSLTLSATHYAAGLLSDKGEDVGLYDSRYTLPVKNSGNDPVSDDPAMGQYVPGFVAAFHQMLSSDLGVKMDRPYGAIVWRDLLPKWNWKRTPLPQDQSFATDLAVAMRRNARLQVLVASGYYDLVTSAAAAQYTVQRADLPADRVTIKRYASGHMLYLGDTAASFASDIRRLIQNTAQK